MTYRKVPWKYQLLADEVTPTRHRPPGSINRPYIGLSRGGVLTVCRGYAWDGPSGPSIDTESFMRGSLVHDALYQLIREGYLTDTDGADRLLADELLRAICREDGMSKLRAWYVFHAVRRFGGAAVAREA